MKHLCLKDKGMWCLIVLENVQPAVPAVVIKAATEYLFVPDTQALNPTGGYTMKP